MQKKTTGTIISVKKQWWMKINKKPVRTAGPLDGAAFPYVAKIRYTIDGKEYTKTFWISADHPVPVEGETVELTYDTDRPSKAGIVYGKKSSSW